MIDLTRSWVRFRALPDDVLADMPDYVRTTFEAARRGGFEVEMLCAGARPPAVRRAPRRFVLAADDVGDDARDGGPVNFDLSALAADVRAANRLFVLATQSCPDLYAAAYAAAVEDLESGFDAAVVVETRPPFASAWVRTLAALREGGTPADLARQSGRGGGCCDALPAALSPRRRRQAS